MSQEEAIKPPMHRTELNHNLIFHVHGYETASVSYTYMYTYIDTYILFNLEFKVAKGKLVSSSYNYDFKTTKTRNYNILIFKPLKRVILTIL